MQKTFSWRPFCIPSHNGLIKRRLSGITFEPSLILGQEGQIGRVVGVATCASLHLQVGDHRVAQSYVHVPYYVLQAYQSSDLGCYILKKI